VLSIVEPLWQDKTETATRVLNRISLILDWATARKLRTGDYPARWEGLLDAMLPKCSKVQRVVSHAALPYDLLPAFFVALHHSGGSALRLPS
jgi:Phage integrase central domain